MASGSNWRSKLLGSLEGQLQLATYTAVLIGFTGATTTGLWLSNRNQIDNGEVVGLFGWLLAWGLWRFWRVFPCKRCLKIRIKVYFNE